MSFESGIIAEKKFSLKLINPVISTREQDMYEHWDYEGGIWDGVYKFEIKGMKRYNRKDENVQDEMALVELQNVNGKPGWIHGKADYIAFERKGKWLTVERKELLDFVEKNKGERSKWTYKKIPYAIYDREAFGRDDRFLWVPFEDIKKLKSAREV